MNESILSYYNYIYHNLNFTEFYFIPEIGESVFSNVVPGETFKIWTNGSLTIHPVQKGHEGLYKCNASNGVGSSLEAIMSLRVIGTVFYCVR